MNYKDANIWFEKHDITLEQDFIEHLRTLANVYKKSNHIRLLRDVYIEFGCTKSSISRWENNPCSTQALCRSAKLSVIRKTAELLHLSNEEAEKLANQAGLSLHKSQNRLSERLKNYNGKYCSLLEQAAVSERMFQYYMAGKEPTKQALLSIAISLILPLEEIQDLLYGYGYYLSKSLANDTVVLWFLTNSYQKKHPALLLETINEVLEHLELPLLMTKLINR